MGTITLSGRETSLLCPGETVKYSCHSSSPVRSITWGVLCPNQRPPPTTFSVKNNNNTLQHFCPAGDGDMVGLNLTFDYVPDDAETQSNISISILEANYSINSAKRLTVDCEQSTDYRYVKLTGE